MSIKHLEFNKNLTSKYFMQLYHFNKFNYFKKSIQIKNIIYTFFANCFQSDVYNKSSRFTGIDSQIFLNTRKIISQVFCPRRSQIFPKSKVIKLKNR